MRFSIKARRFKIKARLYTLARLRPSVQAAFADETGGTLVEFGVAVTLLLTVMLGVMDCSRALYFDHYVRYSADEAVRYAMVRGSTWNNTACTTTSTESCTATGANVTSFVKSITPIGNANALTVTTTWTGKKPSGTACSGTNGNNSPGCVVQVQVSYNFSFVTPFMPRNVLNLTSSAAMAISE
jgi:Flp pilus assembly protein TadG